MKEGEVRETRERLGTNTDIETQTQTPTHCPQVNSVIIQPSYRILLAPLTRLNIRDKLLNVTLK